MGHVGLEGSFVPEVALPSTTLDHPEKAGAESKTKTSEKLKPVEINNHSITDLT